MIQNDQSITPDSGSVSAQPEVTQRSPLAAFFGRLQEIAVVAAGYLDTHHTRSSEPAQQQRLKDFLVATSASVREAAEHLDSYLQIRSERVPSLQEVCSTGLAVTKAAENFIAFEKSLSVADRAVLEASEDGRVVLTELRQSFRELMQSTKIELPAAYAVAGREVAFKSTRDKALAAIGSRFENSESPDERELEANLLDVVRRILDSLDTESERFDEVYAHACLLERQALDRGESAPGHQVFVESLREELLSEIAKAEVLVRRNAAALSEYYALLEAKLENPLAPVLVKRSQEPARVAAAQPRADRVEPPVVPAVSSGFEAPVAQASSAKVLEHEPPAAVTTSPESSAPAVSESQRSGGVFSGLRGKIAAIAALAVVGVGSWFAATRSGRELPKENEAVVAADTSAAAAPKDAPPLVEPGSPPVPPPAEAQVAEAPHPTAPEASPAVELPEVVASAETSPSVPQPVPAESRTSRLKVDWQPIVSTFNETWRRLREAVATQARELSEQARATPSEKVTVAPTPPAFTEESVAAVSKEAVTPEPVAIAPEKQVFEPAMGLGALQNDFPIVEEASRITPALGSAQSPLVFESVEEPAPAVPATVEAQRAVSRIGALSTPLELNVESAASVPAPSGLGASQSSIPAAVAEVPAADENEAAPVLGSRSSEITLVPGAAEDEEVEVVSVPSGTVLQLGGLVSNWNEDVISSLRSPSPVPELPPLAPVVAERRVVEIEDASAVTVRPLPESVAGLGALQSDASFNPRASVVSKPVVSSGGSGNLALGSLESEFVLAATPGEDFVSRSNVPLPERREFLGSLQSPLELIRPAVTLVPGAVTEEEEIRLGSLGSPMSEDEANHAAAAAGETVAAMMLQESLPPYIRPASSTRKKPASN